MRVNRIDWRPDFLFLRGGAIFGPLRTPFLEAKKFRYAACRSWSDCTSTTEGASRSHSRSSVRFAAVITFFCSAVSETYGSPFLHAVLRSRSPSL